MPEKLSKYKSKRKFGKTPEPEESPQSTSGRSYVIQKHDATRLHYDFRLEHAGVLLSWAVPKGPSLDPGVKRLAVHVEDHPVSYGSFEGTIPEGNYGAGTVEIWDSGTWEPLGDVDEMMSKGEMKFLLHGRRLTGKWVLVQMNKNEKDWLLIKEKDEFAKPGDEEGVVERSITPHGKPIDFRAIHPQLATLAERAPTGDDWIHEIKYDGYRLLAWHLDGKVHLITRGGLDWKDKFQEIADAVKQYVPEGTGLDGEVVVFSDQGVSDFGGLQHWLSNGEGNDPQYMTFDLLAINGHEMMSMPLLERKDRLKSMIDAFPKEASYWLRYSDHVQGHGDSMAGEACRKGLEGIISKSARSRYVQARTDTWLKTKCTHQEEFVIGGYTEPGGEREGFGSLLLGQYDSKGNLRYAGQVGTGFDDVLLRSLQKRLAKLERPTSPFVDHSETDGLKAWVEPKLVAQVRYTERTKSGRWHTRAFQEMR